MAKIKKEKQSEVKEKVVKRGTLYDEWCAEGKKEEILGVISELSSLGLNYKNVADALGISEPTFKDWVKKYPEIKEAVRRNHYFLAADSARVLKDIMLSSADDSLRASIAQRFLSYERERWTSQLLNGDEESSPENLNCTINIVKQ